MLRMNDKRTKKLIEIFKDTMRMCGREDALKAAISNSIKGQFIVLDGPLLSEPDDVVHRYNKPAELIVSARRSYEAASEYKQSGKRVCVLNFANAFRPGGRVKEGCTAQEEGLCRCSTLYPCISERHIIQNYHDRHKSLRLKGAFSNIANDDCIYTPEIVVIKTDTTEPELMAEDKWYKTDVITCAAPDLRAPYKNLMNMKRTMPNERELLDIHEKRGRRIIELAKRQKVDVLILGAFGCGAFENSPEIVARAYKKIVQDYMLDFAVIEFAVAGKGRNYEAFKMILE